MAFDANDLERELGLTSQASKTASTKVPRTRKQIASLPLFPFDSKRKAPKGLVAGEFWVATQDGLHRVSGYRHPDVPGLYVFAFRRLDLLESDRKAGWVWSLTHESSGRKIAMVRDPADAILALKGLVDWTLPAWAPKSTTAPQGTLEHAVQKLSSGGYGRDAIQQKLGQIVRLAILARSEPTSSPSKQKEMEIRKQRPKPKVAFDLEAELGLKPKKKER